MAGATGLEPVASCVKNRSWAYRAGCLFSIVSVSADVATLLRLVASYCALALSATPKHLHLFYPPTIIIEIANVQFCEVIVHGQRFTSNLYVLLSAHIE
jgi:hypothetical protein